MTVYSVVAEVFGSLISTHQYTLSTFASKDAAVDFLKTVDVNNPPVLQIMDKAWEECSLDEYSSRHLLAQYSEGTHRLFASGRALFALVPDPALACIREYSLLVYIDELEVVD